MVKEIIGKSQSSEQVRAFISKAAKLDWPVLLIGETGVGKEVAARNIHRLSTRKDKSFIPVNCASIPLTLAESELFGHRRGAFTDARDEKKGLIEDSRGGVVFLDEITEASLDLQAKLLRLLECGEFRRIGETIIRKADTRFIMATNKNPAIEIKHGRLRKDFYYRINIFKLEILPLRERKEDIPLFVDKILHEIGAEFKEEKQLSSKALQKIMDYSFPGNVRELENLIRRAYVLAERKEINPEDIIFEEEEEEEIPVKLFKEMAISIRYIKNFSSFPIVITFFSSFCPRCRSRERIRTLMQLEKMLINKKVKAKLILVFFKPFNESDIHEWENYIEMSFDKYISLEKIFSDEEEYVTDSSLKTDPLTILMMDNKGIEFIETVGMKEIDICKEIEKKLLRQNSTIYKSNFNYK